MANTDEGRILPIPTLLSCRHEGKGEVFVAGTFNGWNPKATPMRRDAKGDWSVELDLTSSSRLPRSDSRSPIAFSRSIRRCWRLASC